MESVARLRPARHWAGVAWVEAGIAKADVDGGRSWPKRRPNSGRETLFTNWSGTLEMSDFRKCMSAWFNCKFGFTVVSQFIEENRTHGPGRTRRGNLKQPKAATVQECHVYFCPKRIRHWIGFVCNAQLCFKCCIFMVKYVNRHCLGGTNNHCSTASVQCVWYDVGVA